MAAQLPKLIGIAGGSCAGKTWLARRLAESLGPEVLSISLDDFYRDRTHLSPARRMRVNFDHPRAIDWERVETVLEELERGGETIKPEYDFTTHGRRNLELKIKAKPIVIVEGLWLFRRAAVRALFDYKIFVKSSSRWASQKRVERDVRERGRTASEARVQWEQFTWPMFERFVAPQMRWADEILESPIPESEVERLTKFIGKDFTIGI
jgi:uridine kinase